MREKTLRAVVTFPSTAAAMAAEALCLARNVPGRLIPAPVSLTAGCGLVWAMPPEARPLFDAAAESAGLAVEARYELLL